MDDQYFSGTYEELTALFATATSRVEISVAEGLLTTEQLDDLRLGGIDVTERVVTYPIVRTQNSTTVVTMGRRLEFTLSYSPPVEEIPEE